MINSSDLTPELREKLISQIDINNPKNAYTVWQKQPYGGDFIHVDGNGRTDMDAEALIQKQKGHKNLLILSVNEKHGLNGMTAVPDDKRISRAEAAHPGSGS